MNLTQIRKTDVNFGLDGEKTILNRLQNLFGDDLEKTTKKYATFDFENNNTLVELKTRRCTSKSFNDTMIGYNKYEFAKKTEKDVYFCFNFTDGLYYHKFDTNHDYNIRNFERYREGEFNKPHVFINNCDMIKA